jgi:hypothetical protein
VAGFLGVREFKSAKEAKEDLRGIPRSFSIPAKAEDIDCWGSDEGCVPWRRISILWIRLRRESWAEESLLLIPLPRKTRQTTRKSNCKNSRKEIQAEGRDSGSVLGFCL